MARSWSRANRQRRCGSCGASLARGAPIQLLTFARVSIEKVRGVCCAEGQPPVDLPALEVRPEIQLTQRVDEMRRAVETSQRVLDWKARATGREPGEDD